MEKQAALMLLLTPQLQPTIIDSLNDLMAAVKYSNKSNEAACEIVRKVSSLLIDAVFNINSNAGSHAQVAAALLEASDTMNNSKLIPENHRNKAVNKFIEIAEKIAEQMSELNFVVSIAITANVEITQKILYITESTELPYHSIQCLAKLRDVSKESNKEINLNAAQSAAEFLKIRKTALETNNHLKVPADISFIIARIWGKAAKKIAEKIQTSMGTVAYAISSTVDIIENVIADPARFVHRLRYRSLINELFWSVHDFISKQNTVELAASFMSCSKKYTKVYEGGTFDADQLKIALSLTNASCDIIGKIDKNTITNVKLYDPIKNDSNILRRDLNNINVEVNLSSTVSTMHARCSSLVNKLHELNPNQI